MEPRKIVGMLAFAAMMGIITLSYSLFEHLVKERSLHPGESYECTVISIAPNSQYVFVKPAKPAYGTNWDDAVFVYSNKRIKVGDRLTARRYTLGSKARGILFDDTLSADQIRAGLK